MDGCDRGATIPRTMGTDMVGERREASLTRRCAWCGSVDTGAGWLPERRAAPTPATHGMCPACQSDALAAHDKGHERPALA